MIPRFDEHGNLPPGIHWATWEETAAHFGGSPERRVLLAGLRRALTSLATAGCPTVYLNGSFVTAKEEPLDYDGCWEEVGVDAAALEDTFLGENAPAKTKGKYLGTLYPVNAIPDPSWAFMLEWFQWDRDGNRKGVIALDMREIIS